MNRAWKTALVSTLPLAVLAALGLTFAPLGAAPDAPVEGPTGLVFTDILPDGTQEVFMSGPNGAGRQPLTAPDGVSSFDPRWSPDGRRVAYIVKTGEGASGVRVLDRASGEEIIATAGFEDFDPSWSPDGRELVFVRHFTFENAIQASVLSVVSPGVSETRDLTLLEGGARYLRNPAWSPDGTRIAFEVRQASGGADLYQIRLANGEMTRVPTHPGWDDVEPAWSPDGRFLAFASGPSLLATERSRHDLWLWDLQRGAMGSLVTDPTRDLRRPDFAPDGRWLVLDAGGGGALRLHQVDWLSGAATIELGQPVGPGFQADWGRMPEIQPEPSPSPGGEPTATEDARPTAVNTGTPAVAPTVPPIPTLVPFPTFPPAEPTGVGAAPTFPRPTASPSVTATASDTSTAGPTRPPDAERRIWLPIVLYEAQPPTATPPSTDTPLPTVEGPTVTAVPGDPLPPTDVPDPLSGFRQPFAR